MFKLTESTIPDPFVTKKLIPITGNASELQIKTIQDVTKRLILLGVNVPVFEEDQLKMLTGGKDGTAYKLINELIELEKETKDNLPLTNEQAEFISKMLYCPDIDWSEYEIDDRHYLEEGRFMMFTRQEFEIELKMKLTKKEAIYFIERYRKAFNYWKQTRIRPQQELVIRKYEEYLRSLEFKRERNVYDDIKADKIAQRSLKKVYNPIAHIPLEDFQLKQFSIEEASVYIKQLKYEIDAKRLYTFKQERNKDDDFEKLRNVKHPSEWATRELRTLQSIIYSLQKESGHVSEKIQHLIPYQDLYTKATKDDPFFTDTNKHAQIVSYMYYIVSNHMITFNQLKFKCQRSHTAIKLLEATKKRLLKDHIYIESLLDQ